MNASTTLLCLGTGLIVSCGNVEQPDELRAERDSAGIRIVDVREPIPEWSVSPDTVLRIGVVDGDPAYQFHRVVYAARLSDGGMVVVDGGAVEVRWFRPTGVHRVTYGRRGEGPGEFREVAEASLSGDTIVVHDPRNQRVMWLSPDGSLTSERTHEGGRQTRLIGASGRNVLAAATHQQFEYSKEYSRLPSIGRVCMDQEVSSCVGT